MKNIYKFIIPIIALILLNECSGYKPIFSTQNLQFKIDSYSIKGNKILGNKLYSKLHNISKSNKNNQNVVAVNLIIDIKKDKESTTKSSAGKVLEYKITLSTQVEVLDAYTDDIVLKQNFVSSSTYKVQEQYSSTLNLENQSIENLIDKIYQELLNSLSENISSV